MAIYSMTGFGRASAEVDGVARGVETRSVNHRYLDVKVRFPRVLAAIEPLARTVAARHCRRGRIEVVIQGSDDESGGAGIEVDLKRARELRAAHIQLAEALDIPLALDSQVVASWPGVLRSVGEPADDDAVRAAFEPILEAAFTQLASMRRIEGLALAADLSGRLDAVEALREVLVAEAPGQNAAYRQRLESRIAALLDAVDVQSDPGRVLHEVAVFAEKADIAEELSRLGSHIEQARGLLASPSAEAVGRRLDFICQEMSREANTVASKVSDIKLSERAIDLKAELERMREQVQNVE